MIHCTSFLNSNLPAQEIKNNAILNGNYEIIRKMKQTVNRCGQRSLKMSGTHEERRLWGLDGKILHSSGTNLKDAPLSLLLSLHIFSFIQLGNHFKQLFLIKGIISRVKELSQIPNIISQHNPTNPILINYSLAN